MLFDAWRDRRPVVGVVHVQPLPGSPRFAGNLLAVAEAVRDDAAALVEGGVDGVIVENFGDAPFYPGSVPPGTVAHMTTMATIVRAMTDLPVGINVLRNDAMAALAVAQAVEADFIRVNVLTGARLGDQGVLRGNAHNLLRERARVGADHIRILADVDVKHSAPLAPYGFEDEVRDTLERGGADGVIVSGSGTGHATDPARVATAVRVAGNAPVFVGSGTTPDTVGDLSVAAGYIVGTWIKQDGRVDREVDAGRVATMVAAVRRLDPA